MTSKQVLIIRESFDILREQAIPVTMLFYDRMFALDPTIKPLFKGDMREQSRKLVDTLDALVASLDDFDAMRPALREMGRKHRVEYGVKTRHYDTLSSAFLWTLAHALDGGLDAEARHAWTVVIQAVNLEMKTGAAEAAA